MRAAGPTRPPTALPYLLPRCPPPVFLLATAASTKPLYFRWWTQRMRATGPTCSPNALPYVLPRCPPPVFLPLSPDRIPPPLPQPSPSPLPPDRLPPPVPRPYPPPSPRQDRTASQRGDHQRPAGRSRPSHLAPGPLSLSALSPFASAYPSRPLRTPRRRRLDARRTRGGCASLMPARRPRGGSQFHARRRRGESQFVRCCRPCIKRGYEWGATDPFKFVELRERVLPSYDHSPKRAYFGRHLSRS